MNYELSAIRNKSNYITAYFPDILCKCLDGCVRMESVVVFCCDWDSNPHASSCKDAIESSLTNQGLQRERQMGNTHVDLAAFGQNSRKVSHQISLDHDWLSFNRLPLPGWIALNIAGGCCAFHFKNGNFVS